MRAASDNPSNDSAGAETAPVAWASAGPAARGRSYIPGLDGIRAIAFLLVFGAHALPGWSFFIPATLGVTIFFFLSGYLITTLLRRELEVTGTLSLRRFYLRRTLRIFVPLYVVYALAAACAHFVLHDPVGNRLGLLSLVFYFYNYATALDWRAWLPSGLNVIWSLSVEEHFYLLFPLALLGLGRRGAGEGYSAFRRGILAFCAAELVWRVLLTTVLHQHNFWTYYATDARLDSILFGCLLALAPRPALASRTPTRRDRLWFLLSLVVLAASLIPRSYYYRETLRYSLQGVALYVVFRYVVANAHRWPLAWLEWTPLRYIGWISYVLYLSHEFILNALVARLPGRLALTAPLGLAIAVSFATLMRYTLELPLQRLRAHL